DPAVAPAAGGRRDPAVKRRAFLGAVGFGLYAIEACVEVAHSRGANEPTFTKGKFAVPVSREEVKQDWLARGYSDPKVQSYSQGWSREEHTHPVNLIMTVLSGRMEFAFSGQQFILHPGDELLYPAGTVHSAKNTHDGTTQILESYK